MTALAIVTASNGSVCIDFEGDALDDTKWLSPEQAFELAAELQHRATRAMIQLERDKVYD